MGLGKKSLLRLEPLEDRCLLSANVVLEWNRQVLDAIKLTNTNPLVASRALAIAQVAVYDAVNAIDGAYAPYAFDGQAPPGASAGAAAAAAAYHTLVDLFPTRKADFDSALASSLAAIPDGPAENQGIAVGQAAASAILALRRHDGFDAVVAYTPGTDPGDWQPTPPGFLAPLGPQWPQVTPFAMTSGSQFRPDGPPALGSADYAAAFNEVKSLGRRDSATRTEEQTEIAFFWRDAAGTSYALGHWNIIAQEVVCATPGRDLIDDARLLALVNIATADAIIATWDAKYAYNFWRPITAIQSPGTDALNPDTTSDATWTPLIGTPNFPSYTSAHSTVSAAAAAILTDEFGDDYQFTTGSEGLADVTRKFASFNAAATEAGESRIYGGIHFRFESVDGLEAGGNVANYVLDNFLLSQDGDELRAAIAAPEPVNEVVRADQVQPLLAEALARWQAAGIDTSALDGIDVRIAGLGGLTLGRAADGVLWLDDNAAGWGWFVDVTPGDDSEFTTPGDQGEAGRMDLLTVLEHEIGHLLGHEHEESGLMQDTLTAGTRRSIAPVTAEDSLVDVAFMLFSADEENSGTGFPGRDESWR